MFWSKRSKPSPVALPESVQDLANRLGIERRLNVRVYYPPQTTATLPAIKFNQITMRVLDLSVGGCCLIDVEGHLGMTVGHEVPLVLDFPDAQVAVRSRIQGSVNDRRHIQFMDLGEARVAQIRERMRFGVRALGMKRGLKAEAQGPSMAAREFWFANNGDCVIVEDGLQRLGQIEINNDVYAILREAWPVDRDSKPVSNETLHHLILYFANITSRSPALKEMLAHLESLVLGGAR